MANGFELKENFLCKDGPARSLSESYCNKKLCFTATNQDMLKEVLLELSHLEDCYFVKLSAEPKDGMYLGRCFFTSEKRVGEVWAKFKSHPKLFCNIHDDDFTKDYRRMA